MVEATTLATIIGRLALFGEIGDRIRLALLRALRTFIQGVAAAFAAAGPGSAILSTSYWRALGYSCLAAGITGVVSFLQNIATFLPEDPTVRPPAS